MNKLLLIICLIGGLYQAPLFAQSVVNGSITDEDGQPVIGAAIRIQGTTIGVTSNLDGNYSLSTEKEGNVTLEATLVGYEKQFKSVTLVKGKTINLKFVLKPSVSSLNEVIVVGYGTTEKKDLTGAVASINSKDFNQGNLNTPEQLVLGKVAGVQITPNGGAPGSGSTIRIRGGSSLNASNDPLIVIDGVPVANDGIAGAPNPLSLINPNDIENITILKDASATAIYGSRASNGVIIITTKKSKGSSKFKVEFNTVNSAAVVAKYANVFSGDEMREFVSRIDPASAGKLGTANTDWQKEIYRTALSSDNIFTFSGGVKKLPYRLSVGYLNQNGLLIRDNMQRGTANLNLAPTFFDEHLKIEINQKATISKSFFANQGAIGSAVVFDPTQPVRTDSPRYGGFFEWQAGAIPNVLSPRNPLGLIEQQDDQSNVFRSIGNIQADYKFHFLPELRANLNIGYDYSNGSGSIRVADSAAASYGLQNKGLYREYEQKRENKLMEFYLNYKRSFDKIKSVIDVVAGYSYQDWYFESPNIREVDGQGDTIVGTQAPTFPFAKSQNTLISAYGRLNYTFNKRYLLTVTLRNDGSSRFAPDERWGLFPSAAFAWRIAEEKWLSGFKNLTDLKLRLGYGQTGQQDVGANFNYLPLYTQGEQTAAYQFGNTFYYTLRPNVYDPKFRWESTTTYNGGLDYGFYNGRISGSVDLYYKRTTDLIAEINIPAGINFGTRVLTNVGEIENKGIEIILNTVPIVRKDFELNVGVNFTANRNKVIALDRFPNPNDLGAETGGIQGNVGSFIQINSVGFPIQTFFVFEQKYDGNGKPIEVNDLKPDGTKYTLLDAYVDRNNDGKINDQDRYRYKNAAPQFFMGYNVSATYKKWFMSLVARGSFGNYVYNNFASNAGTVESIITPQGNINNGSKSVLESDFNARQLQSDYYVEKATFIRMDNISFGYNVGSIFKGKASMRVFGAIQNAFIISSYSGIDPEIFNGIDNNIYPRPRTFSIGANIQL
jgi:TonB-dependent starch-binding outer membrane protein SusC